MQLKFSSLLITIVLSLSACTSPSQPNSNSASRPQAYTSERASPEPTANPALTRADPANPSRSCRSDADCAVKDVGNCCGYYPMCVNKDAATDPAAVRAACASEGMAAVCGFREVRGCTCKAGVCEDLSAAGPGAEVVR